ncbi:MAG: GNAT family N-acetyltransferase [Desulfobacterales bacterium]|jgi:ribosomal protein S18 acetylase RimI-like enzyme
MGIIISPFTIDCYEGVYALWEQCQGIALSGADSRDNIALYLKRNPEMSFVAIDDGDIAGSILSGHDGRRGYIHHLAVKSEYRRQGLGRKLAEKCVSALQKAGIQKCHLFIFNHNTGGLAFWKAIGWTRRSELNIISKIIEHPT